MHICTPTVTYTIHLIGTVCYSTGIGGVLGVVGTVTDRGRVAVEGVALGGAVVVPTVEAGTVALVP